MLPFLFNGHIRKNPVTIYTKMRIKKNVRKQRYLRTRTGISPGADGDISARARRYPEEKALKKPLRPAPTDGKNAYLCARFQR